MRKGTRKWRFAALLLAMGMVAAACGDGDGDTTTTAGTGTGDTTTAPAAMTPINLQLQWFAQAQFAGYYAALDQGYYAEEGLDVNILEGAVEIVPQQVVASGQADFGLAWVPKALLSNEEDAGLVNIGQVFQRSGTLMVSWADTGITSPEDWAGRTVGNWGFGNEFELTAAIEKFAVPSVSLVAQNFDMEALLNREVDAAEAMIYNEYAQVLEATNEDTGELYQPEDLAVIDFNDVGTAMLQDSIWVSESWLADNEDAAEKFLRASFRGWIYCRDNPDACVDIVLAAGPTLGRSHQTWQMNEINGLIWPSPNGIGVMDQALWDQTIEVAVGQGVISADPGSGAFRTDLAEKALAGISEDTTGADWTRLEVTLNPGGE